MTTTITIVENHGLKVGDKIKITFYVYDRRWWMRLWHWITFRPAPIIEKRHQIISEVTSDSFTINV